MINLKKLCKGVLDRHESQFQKWLQKDYNSMHEKERRE